MVPEVITRLGLDPIGHCIGHCHAECPEGAFKNPLAEAAVPLQNHTSYREGPYL